MFNGESGKSEYVNIFLPKSLKHFLEIELMTAKRVLVEFGGSEFVAPMNSGVQEEGSRIINAIVRRAMRNLDEYQQALDNLDNGDRGPANSLLDNKVETLTATAHRCNLHRCYETARRTQERIDALIKIKES